MNLARTIRRVLGIKPKLNCWPGALCHVIDDGTVAGKFLGGKTVTVTSLQSNFDGEPAWCYEGRQFLIVLGFEIVEVAWIPDAMLRPITPPPGTVIGDESLELPLVNIVKELV